MRKSYFLLALLLVGCAPTSTVDLKTYTSEEFGVSVDSPFPLQFETAGEKYTVLTLEGRAVNPTPRYLDIAKFTITYLMGKKAKMDMFQMSLFAYRSAGTKSYNSKTIIDRSIHNFAALQKGKVSGFKYKNIPLQAGSMPATLTSGSFEIHNKEFSSSLYIHNLIVVRKNQYWRLYCAYQDSERYDDLVKKIIQSLKITPK